MAHYTLTDLTDPQTFQTEYPQTVHSINPVYWDNIGVDTFYVRIRRKNEYFWVQVREISGDDITGEVYYELGINSFQIGDTLTFNKCYVFDIYDQQVFNLIPGITDAI